LVLVLENSGKFWKKSGGFWKIRVQFWKTLEVSGRYKFLEDTVSTHTWVAYTKLSVKSTGHFISVAVLVQVF